jgi:hypothetical protein
VRETAVLVGLLHVIPGYSRLLVQATELKEHGISDAEHRALCDARQHTEQVCNKHYEKINRKR